MKGKNTTDPVSSSSGSRFDSGLSDHDTGALQGHCVIQGYRGRSKPYCKFIQCKVRLINLFSTCHSFPCLSIAIADFENRI